MYLKCLLFARRNLYLKSKILYVSLSKCVTVCVCIKKILLVTLSFGDDTRSIDRPNTSKHGQDNRQVHICLVHVQCLILKIKIEFKEHSVLASPKIKPKATTGSQTFSQRRNFFDVTPVNIIRVYMRGRIPNTSYKEGSDLATVVGDHANKRGQGWQRVKRKKSEMAPSTKI